MSNHHKLSNSEIYLEISSSTWLVSDPVLSKNIVSQMQIFALKWTLVSYTKVSADASCCVTVDTSDFR